MNNAEVTVITVVKNSKETIARCIDSVLIQKNLTIESLVIDGISTDGTLDLLYNYRNQIRLISEEDKGVYDAMNKAVHLANGRFIIFLNADDYFLDKDSLSSLYESIQKTKSDYACGSAKMLYGLKIWRPRTLSDADFLVGNPSNHQAYLIKTSILRKLNGFDLQYKYAADVDFMFRVIANGYNGIVVDKIVVNYSMGGISTKNIEAGIKELHLIMSKYLKIKDNRFVKNVSEIFAGKKMIDKRFLLSLRDYHFTENQYRYINSFLGKIIIDSNTSCKHLLRIKFFIRELSSKVVFNIIRLFPKKYI